MAITENSGISSFPVGGFQAYSLRWTSNTLVGFYQWAPVTAFNNGAGMYWVYGPYWGVHVPDADNTYTMGASGHRWTDVWAFNGINTSHSDFKRDIKILENVPVPRGISYKWKDTEGTDKDRTYIGFLADDLPKEAFEYKEDGSIDKTGVHPNAVLGILCEAVIKLQNDINTTMQEVDILLGA